MNYLALYAVLALIICLAAIGFFAYLELTDPTVFHREEDQDSPSGLRKK